MYNHAEMPRKPARVAAKTAASDLVTWSSSLDAITRALKAARYKPPHANISSFREPYYLVPGDLTLESLALTTGTLVIRGELTISRWLDVQRDGRPLANIIVLGSCKLAVAYLDGFLAIKRDLTVGTFIGDTTWSGGLYVNGDVSGDSVILVDMDATIRGKQRARLFATSDDFTEARAKLPKEFEPGRSRPDARRLFLARR